MAYTVTFWGTRGSIPTPGAHTARYGGNTPCVAVEGTGGGGDNGQGQLVILDAGTGIRALGRELVERQNGAVQAEILLSHAHWDHIQGLPHFKPFFSPGNAVRIWGSRQGPTPLEATLRQQMDPAGFPVPLDALSPNLTVRQVGPVAGEFRVAGFGSRGWGHSTVEEAVTRAADAGVRRLVLFHHEPEHGDADVDGMLAAARRVANARGTPAEVLAAQEGATLTL